MANKQFNLKLIAEYATEKNDIADLQVYIKDKDTWQPLALDIKSPGFLLFINGLFSCQHLYMRVNSAERDIVLASTVGEMKIETDEYWQIQTAEVRFKSKIKSGKVSDDAHHYISERMHHCPVSSNLPASIKLKNTLTFY